MRKVILWSLIVAIGGFLFGFDTAVISGAEQAIQKYWSLSDFQHGFTMSIALIGTMFGALFGRIPADSIGRKKTLTIIACIFLVSALGTALATNWYLFMVLRFCGGIAVGSSSVIAPVYISEIAPPTVRGRLVMLFQLSIVFGILIAYGSNYVIGQANSNSWRYMLGVMAVPSIFFLLFLYAVPESPRWLLLQPGRNEEALKSLQIINPLGYKDEMDEIIATNKADADSPGGDKIFTSKYRFPIILAILFAFFNQVSGINAIIYYAPRIFEMTGLGNSTSLLSTFGVGIVNFCFTIISLFLIDGFGRRKLMFVGSFGLIVALGLVSYIFFKQNFSHNYILWCILAFIAFFSFSQGAVIWVFISEIFPNRVRAKGQTLGSFTHWVMAALITFAFPYFAKHFGGGYIFLFFTVMMVLQLLFVWRLMPETKGKSLEELDKILTGH